MQYHIDSKGFELHDAQKYIIENGLTKLSRYCKKFPHDSVQANVVISCHPETTPVFTSHIYVELPNQRLTSQATERKFTRSFKEALEKLITQLRTHKAKLKHHNSYQQARTLRGKA